MLWSNALTGMPRQREIDLRGARVGRAVAGRGEALGDPRAGHLILLPKFVATPSADDGDGTGVTLQVARDSTEVAQAGHLCPHAGPARRQHQR